MSKKSPQLRFEGFTDDWEKRKLGEHTSLITKGTTPKDKSGNGTINFVKVENISNGVISSVSKISEDEHENYLKRSKLEDKDVLFSIAGTLGRTAVVDKSILPANTNQALAIIRGYDFDTYFLTTTLNGHVVAEFVRKNPTVGAQPNLSLEQVGKLIIGTPCKIEQNKIGTFFKQLDDFITLHQRKLDLLKEQKKGYLQNMFPKNGAKVPELRFAGFADDWEERKLGDLANIVRGASPRPIQDSKWFDKDSDIGWLRISDVTDQNGRIHHLEQRISKLGQEKTRVLKEPHLLLSIAATVGKPLVNYVKTGVHDGFLIFLNPSFEREFMFQWLEMFRPNWKKYGQPGSQVNLNSELVRNQEIPLPSIEEQQKIGSFFKQLDDTIALHQRKLDLLKEQKKGFLQKMFV